MLLDIFILVNTFTELICGKKKKDKISDADKYESDHILLPEGQKITYYFYVCFYWCVILDFTKLKHSDYLFYFYFFLTNDILRSFLADANMLKQCAYRMCKTADTQNIFEGYIEFRKMLDMDKEVWKTEWTAKSIKH